MSKILTPEARLIVARGDACCANCLYSAAPANANPFRPALNCQWFKHCPRLPKSWKLEGVDLPIDVDPAMQGCPAWEKGDTKL